MTTAAEGGELGPADHGRAAGPPVDRDGELALLSAAVRDAAAGRPGLVVLDAPDGMGRTTLMNGLVFEAHAAGLRVLRAEGAAAGHTAPLSTVRALLEPLSDGATRRPSARHPTARPGEEPPRHDVLPRSDVRGGDVPHGVLDALHQVVRRAARERPLLIAVDDAHAAEPASLRFLAHVARRPGGLPVVLCVARRSGGGSPLLDEIAALPMCRVLRPLPLTPGGIGLLARRLTGRDVDDGFGAACRAATGGSPLLVTHLLTALRDARLPPTADALAALGAQDLEGFRACVVHLLDGQPTTVRGAARALAVLGDGTPRETCARLAALDPGVFERCLAALGAVGLVDAQADGGTWSFAHPQVRAAAVTGVSSDGRSRLHGLAARLLHESGADVTEVAEQLRQSPESATRPWALTVLREAAREMTLQGFPDRAVELLRPCVPPGHEGTCAPELLLDLGLAESRVDPSAGAARLAVALDRLTCPHARLTALGALAGALMRSGEVSRATALIDRCREYGTDSAAAASSAQLLEAQLLLVATGHRATYSRLLDSTSLDLGLPGDTAARRALLASRAVVCAARADRVAEARDAARTVLAHGTPVTDAVSTLGTAASVLLYTDRPRESAEAFRQLLDAPHVTREEAYPTLLALTAEAHARLGALGEALRTTTAALQGVAPAPAPATRLAALPLAVRLHTLLDQGDLAAASALVRHVPGPLDDEAWQWNEVLCARGRLRLASGDVEGALDDLTECGRRQRAWHRTSPAVSSWWYWAGRSHLARGDRATARQLADDTIESARAAHLPCALAQGLELRAATEAARHRPLLLQEAEAVLATTSAALLLARVRVARGRALHRCGDKQAARAVLRKAWEETYALGAPALHAEAHTALLATGARPRRPVPSGVDALTRSERRVAKLADSGLTNAVIARTLCVTRRTVEVHLTAVYRKLNVAGRRELRFVLRAADEGAPHAVGA
ncbi:AAA family ATPase [Streptomyces longwoodensis]|uniref:helix-turn-helix transcriptional regulator n=1 Tax=Streptomyces longwoodensis TaxID=68231 RepID=UPI003817E966